MNAARSYLDYIQDVREPVGQVGVSLAGVTYEEFREDGKTAYAVIRALEILGEAAKN